VGYAGLTEHAEPGCAEHGLTCVRRDRRGQGIARALKQAQLCWAAGSGVHTLTTWTQQGNERMQGSTAASATATSKVRRCKGRCRCSLSPWR
jgi:GNAT superfamily N-acetyltransferase